MGCWNHTCAISNLPVHYNDKVIVLILKARYTLDPNCSDNTMFWSPFPAYFEGSYNDYGAVENCHGPMLPYILDTLKTMIVEYAVGDNKYHDIEVSAKNFTVEKLFEADHENRLQAKPTQFERNFHGATSPSPLKHIVILKSVFDKIISTIKCGEYDDNYKRLYRGRDELKEQAKQLADHIIKLRTIDRKVDDGVILAFEMQNQIEQLNSIGRHIWFSRMGISNWDISTKCELTLSSGMEQNLIHFFLNQYVDLMLLDLFMVDARKMWVPTTGSGSQSSSTYGQELLASIIMDGAAKIKKRYEE